MSKQLVMFKNEVLQLFDLVENTNYQDVRKAYAGNKAAMVRVRKQLLAIQKQSSAARKEIMNVKNNLKITKCKN